MLFHGVRDAARRRRTGIEFVLTAVLTAALSASASAQLGPVVVDPRSGMTPLKGNAAGAAAGPSDSARRPDARRVPDVWQEDLQLPEMRDDAALWDVFFLDDQTGWAVGDRGVIWHTATGGRQWRMQSSGAACQLNSVHFVDAQNGWAVGGFTKPYAGRTEGVVLRTQDGGRRWQRISTPALPRLSRVKFVSPNEGWALGDSSAMFPGGVFTSNDGGRSWSPVPDQTAGGWLCGDFRDQQGGAAAGRLGRVDVVTRQGAIGARTPGLGLRSVKDMRLSGRTGGWLCGDGGLVLQTSDGGLTWRIPSGRLPPAVLEEFDFASVAVRGRQVWVAGTPGTVVFHSPDAGRSWQRQTTGQTTPIHALHFADPEHGFAVGALGIVLGTRDGGRTWHRQRSGGARAALLAIFHTSQRLPLELIADVGADKGCLAVAELVGRRDHVSLFHPDSGDAAARAHEAFVLCGGSLAGQAWRFPSPSPRWRPAAEEFARRWNRLQPQGGTPQLDAHLVRKIRQWRPSVIVTHGSSPSGADPAASLINQAVQRAVDAAASETAFPEQLQFAGLSPWQVDKVFARLDDGAEGSVNLTAARLSPRLGRSLADHTFLAGGVASGARAAAGIPRLSRADVAAAAGYFAERSVQRFEPAARRGVPSKACAARRIRKRF